jgi:hypothetical protein
LLGDFSVLNFLGRGNHCVSIPWIVLGSLDHILIWIQISSLVTRPLKPLQDRAEIGPKRLVKQALDYASDPH